MTQMLNAILTRGFTTTSPALTGFKRHLSKEIFLFLDRAKLLEKSSHSILKYNTKLQIETDLGQVTITLSQKKSSEIEAVFREGKLFAWTSKSYINEKYEFSHSDSDVLNRLRDAHTGKTLQLLDEFVSLTNKSEESAR